MRFRTAVLICLLFAGINSALGQSSSVPYVRFADFRKNLSSESDTVYVINFWATWCAPCRKELPAFEKIHKDYSEKKVKVLLVSLDFPKEAGKSLKNFLSVNKISAAVILLNEPDANAWIDKVDPGWSGALPATLIYKKNNRKFFDRELTYEEINQSVVELNNL
jgi:thiol-disulfide isomerase/thioredoxin